MEGIWVVLSKAAVITWLIVLVSGSILAIVIGIVEYRDLKKGESAAGEDFEVTATDRGIITECEKSNCCAAGERAAAEKIRRVEGEIQKLASGV